MAKPNGVARYVAEHVRTKRRTVHDEMPARISEKRINVRGYVFERATGREIQSAERRIFGNYRRKLLYYDEHDAAAPVYFSTLP